MKTSHYLIAILLVAAGLCRAGAQSPFVVPFETIKSEHMVVQVKINGKGPYRLIFDTGAPDSLVNNKLAKEAGIFPKDFKKPLLAPLGAMGQFKMQTIEMGNLKAENLSVMVVDHPTVAAISEVAGPIDGIVGFTFFSRYKMTIDYQTKVMTFVPNDYRPTSSLDTIMAMLLTSSSERAKPKVLAPGALFGFTVDKEKTDVEPGVYVRDVMDGTPAAKAGLKAGDRLLTFDNRWTDTVADCYQAASYIRPGTTVNATILRDGKEMKLKIKGKAGL